MIAPIYLTARREGRVPAMRALAEARETVTRITALQAAYDANPHDRDALSAVARAMARAGAYRTGRRIWPAVTWSADRRMMYVTHVDGRGALRDLRRANEIVSRIPSGWYTNDEGESYKDGSGLIWGVVASLSHGRYLAGYQDGGSDAGPTLSAEIFTDESDAAYAADSMAERAAEREREYNGAWRMGRDWADAHEQEHELRREFLAIAPHRTGLDCPIARLMRQIVDDIAESRRQRDDLADPLRWSDPDLRLAWCEGADMTLEQAMRHV